MSGTHTVRCPKFIDQCQLMDPVSHHHFKFQSYAYMSQILNINDRYRGHVLNLTWIRDTKEH